MRRSLSHLKIVPIFISSFTFRLWQQYCRLRDQFSPMVGGSHKYYTHKLSEGNIRKYILPSQTFKLWRYTYQGRQFIFLKFMQPITKHLLALIPQSVKNQIKLFGSLFHFSQASLDPRIIREWELWNKARPDASLDILNFGVISYDYRFQRPQQLAVALAKRHHRIFYIETEFSYALSSQVAKIKVRKAASNVYVVTLSAPANYFIYRDTPRQKGVDILMASLKILLRQARIINPVAKLDHPFWGVLRSSLSMPIIYDVMDLHVGFKESGKTILDKHRDLVQNSDLVLASSNYLKRTLVQETTNLIMLKNASEYSHFRSASKPGYSRPSDLRELQGPILGYYGALADWLDTDLIEDSARAFPSASLVFIGRIQNNQLEVLAKKYPNIHLLGEKPYQDLPQYLSYFDVCLIPFKLTQLIQATNPVKIYEYFAAGKPVVATPIPELKVYAKLLYFGSTSTQFCSAISHAIKEHSTELRRARQLVSSQNTWVMRAETLHTQLMQFFPKVSVVILVYNHTDLSKISIDSTLKRSKYPNLELLAVDNKSDAKTRKMLNTYRGVPNVKVVLNPANYGFAKGNNVGMKLASGEYIILLNNDVCVTPGWIERLVYHARGKDIGLVGPVTNSIGNESKIEIEYDGDKAKEIEEKSADYIYAHWGEALKLRNIAAFAWLKSKAVYQKLGGLDERFGRGLFEDDDYCMRVSKANLKILCTKDAFVHHYGGASTNWGSPEYQLLFNTNKAKFEAKWGVKWTPHQYRK
ncbi:MAG: glycosyltransferase [bacterium]